MLRKFFHLQSFFISSKQYLKGVPRRPGGADVVGHSESVGPIRAEQVHRRFAALANWSCNGQSGQNR